MTKQQMNSAKAQGAEASEKLKEEYKELQSIIAETLFEAYEKVQEAVQLARKAKELSIDPEDIEYDESMEEIDETKYDIEKLLNEL